MLLWPTETPMIKLKQVNHAITVDCMEFSPLLFLSKKVGKTANNNSQYPLDERFPKMADIAQEDMPIRYKTETVVEEKIYIRGITRSIHVKRNECTSP